MKSRSERLRKIVNLARAEEKKACEEMSRAQKTLNTNINRLRELESYKHNYAQNLPGLGTVSAARWQDNQTFLNRIDRALAGQKALILADERLRDSHRRRWLVERQKLESLERVVNRFRRSEADALDRQSQQAQDELVATGKYYRIRLRD